MGLVCRSHVHLQLQSPECFFYSSFELVRMTKDGAGCKPSLKMGGAGCGLNITSEKGCVCTSL